MKFRTPLPRPPAILLVLLAPSFAFADDHSAGTWTRSELKSLAARVAAEEGVSPALFDALITAESNYDIKAVSPKGAMSLAQLMPATARDLGLSDDERFEPEANLRGAARYLRGLLDEAGDVSVALAAYNAGMGRVRDRSFDEWPRETRAYVSKILERVAAQSAQARLIGSIVSMPKPQRAGDAKTAAAESDVATAPAIVAVEKRDRENAAAAAPDSASSELAKTKNGDTPGDDDLIVDFSGMTDLSTGAGV